MRDRDQWRHIGLHGVAGRDGNRAGAPGVGRHDAGVGEGNAGCVDGGLVSRHHGQLGLDLRPAGIECALRDEVLRQQLLGTGPLALRVGERGIVLGQLRLRLGDIGLVGACIEREQGVPCLDKLAVLDVHLAHDIAGLRANIDAGQRRDRSGGFEQAGEVPFACGHRAHGDGWAGARCRHCGRAGGGRGCSRGDLGFATATDQCGRGQATHQGEQIRNVLHGFPVADRTVRQDQLINCLADACLILACMLPEPLCVAGHRRDCVMGRGRIQRNFN